MRQIHSLLAEDSRAAEGNAGQVGDMRSIKESVIDDPHDSLYPDSAIIITITHVRGCASA